MHLKVVFVVGLIVYSILANFNMPKRVIDQIQMVTVVGYDFVDEKTIKGTMVSPFYLQQNELQDLHYTGKGQTIYGIRGKLNSQASEELYNGKIEVALFNKELGEHGLSDFIDYMLRDPSIGSRIYLGIVEKSSESLLTGLQSRKGAGVYLSDLMEHNIQNSILPETNLKQYNYGLEKKMIDPFLPYLTVKKNKPVISGIALFEQDKLVDVLSYDQSFVFKMLYQDVEDGQYNLNKEEYRVSVHDIESTRDVRVKGKEESIQVVFKVNFIGVLREYTGGVASKKIKRIESDLERDFKQRAGELISRFKELNIDPLGLESHIKVSGKLTDMKQFNDIYQDLPVDIKISFNIAETGTRK